MIGSTSTFQAVKGQNIIIPTIPGGLVAEALTAHKRAGYTGLQKQEEKTRPYP